MREPDFLERMIARRTAANPGFGELLEAARKRRRSAEAEAGTSLPGDPAGGERRNGSPAGEERRDGGDPAGEERTRG
jgi:hypothetical protein